MGKYNSLLELSNLIKDSNSSNEYNNIDNKSFIEKSNNLSKNVIQLRNGFVNLPNLNLENRELAVSVASELMQFGYLLNEDAISSISKSSIEEIDNFLKETIHYLKVMTGSERSYKAFWTGFPTEVMNRSELELWTYQIAHYISNGEFSPSEWTRNRPTAFENSEYTIIKSGNDVNFLNIFTNLVSVNNSLTKDDTEIIEWFIENEENLILPEVIPFKENLCLLASLGVDVPIKTVTDVLRIAVFNSGGDVSLPKIPNKKVRVSPWSNQLVDNPLREDFKFKNFPRKERKYLLNLLEQTNCDSSEAKLKIGRWIRLGEILHPGEYKNRFPKAFKMFNELRNEKVDSWYSKVNKSFNESFNLGLETLSERPGEFFRRIDALIRNNEQSLDIILNYVKDLSSKVSNKVLFEVYEHFESRSDYTYRTVMIKGARNNYKLPDLEPLSEEVTSKIKSIIKISLKEKFKQLTEIKNVWVDEELKKIPIPKNMKSLNSSLKPIVRGQRTPIGNFETKVIRAFVHWFDEDGSEDLDLTGIFIGYDKIVHIGWNGSHNSILGCYSGDIRHRKGANAEYVDIKVKEALSQGYKFVVIDVQNYNGTSFKTVKECVAGYMEREFAEAGETFLPSTIKGCQTLQNDSNSTIISVIDLETREYIHLDVDSESIPVASANFQEILNSIRVYCEPPNFSVYDLIMMHIESRNGNVVEKENADEIFEYKDFENSYIETLKLMGI